MTLQSTKINRFSANFSKNYPICLAIRQNDIMLIMLFKIRSRNFTKICFSVQVTLEDRGVQGLKSHVWLCLVIK